MKKIIKTLLIVMVIAMAVMALASCEQDPCKDGHTLEAIGEKLATCTENGYSSGVVCSVCGYVERNSFVLEAKGHSMSDATCTDPSTCTVCGHVEGEALGHAFTVEVEALEPTCAADGYTAHKACERGCGETEGKETIPATGAHEYTVEVEAVDPTCVSAGHNAYHACECGAKGEDYVEIPAVADNHNFDENELFYYPEPTCTTPGYIAGYCTGCGKGFLLQEVPATGHVDEDADGLCDVCAGAAQAPHTHEWSNPTCTEPAKCECGETQGEPTGHDYDHVVTAPTCTVAGYTTHTCAFCDHSYTDSEVEATGHVDANGDYKCDSCSTKMLPADGTTLTVEQALLVAELGGTAYTTEKYYISGIVSGLYNTTYVNFYIKNPETGKEICIYGLYNHDGTVRYDAMSYKPVNGDEITVLTVLGKYSSTLQGKNAWLDEVVAHEHNYTSVVTDPTCLKDGFTTHTCSICGDEKVDTVVDALGHTTASGTCERCGTVVGESASTDPVTVSKTIKDLITQYGWTGSTTKQSFELDNVVSVKINGGSNTGKAYNGDHIRIYATDTPAGTITISVPEGYELVSIKITTQTGTYAFLYVDGTTTDICNKTVEVSGNSVLLNSVKNGSDGKQVRVTAIEVTYKPVG